MTVENDIRAYFGLPPHGRDGADLSKVEQLAAAIDSINYINALPYEVQRFKEPAELLTFAMNSRKIEGLLLEFGVFSGKSINQIAGLTSQDVYGFDSFKGLPETWRSGFPEGTFQRPDLPQVRDNVKLVVGWFDETLPSFAKKHGANVSLLHVDCDLYSSTRTVFHFLSKQIVPGTVIVFDEYLNYVGWRSHEHKAFQEFVAAHRLAYRYIGFVPTKFQVAAIIL